MSSARAPRAAPRIVLRPTEPGDLAALGALFDERFGHPVTPEEWQWKYRHLPGEARSWVAVDDRGRVLAHAGALGLPARVRRVQGAEPEGSAAPVATGGAGGGRPDAVSKAPIWQLTDWAGTAAATGLRPPLVRLGRRLLGDLPRPGDAPWIFGFPSERHFRLGRRVFGYRTLPGIVELAGDIAAAADATAGAPELAVPSEHCGDWPEAAEAAWEGCGVLGVRRSAAFLNWRYHARPGRYYRFYRLLPSRGGERTSGRTSGLAVFAFVGTEALAAELWLPSGGADAPIRSAGSNGSAASDWLPALRAVAADLAAAGLTRWRFWPPPERRVSARAPGAGGGPAGLADLLERLGVRATGEARFMGSRGPTGARAAGHPADPHFYYAMGDYDLV